MHFPSKYVTPPGASFDENLPLFRAVIEQIGLQQVASQELTLGLLVFPTPTLWEWQLSCTEKPQHYSKAPANSRLKQTREQ